MIYHNGYALGKGSDNASGNGSLAEEQPELDKLKRQHVPLRMVREMQKGGNEHLFIEKLVK